MTGVVQHIHIAASAGEPMQSMTSARARTGIGLEGDRYASGLGHYSGDRRVSRDLTLVESEAIEALRVEHKIALSPGETRRNITTGGLRLDGLVGRRFYVGEALCLGTRRCNPCQYLADLVGQPLLRPLVGRGGLRADLLTDAVIHVGDPVASLPTADLVIGTTNTVKARQCELALAGLDVRIWRLASVLPHVRPADEIAEAPGENARIKASQYAMQLDQPVLALDFALTFDGFDADGQPGARVRRVFGAIASTDDEMLIERYAHLIERHGGRVEGEWQVAMTVVTPRSLFESHVSFSRTFVSRRSESRIPGYPLASLQLAVDGRYVSDLGQDAVLYPEIAAPLRRLVGLAVSQKEDACRR